MTLPDWLAWLPRYSEFDPIEDTESDDDLASIEDARELQRVRSDRGY